MESFSQTGYKCHSFCFILPARRFLCSCCSHDLLLFTAPYQGLICVQGKLWLRADLPIAVDPKVVRGTYAIAVPSSSRDSSAYNQARNQYLVPKSGKKGAPKSRLLDAFEVSELDWRVCRALVNTSILEIFCVPEPCGEL